MLTLYTEGYGYSKRLCENATFWFMNKFLPRHKITLEILHRGLNREGAFGYCQVCGDTLRPREFLIELNTYMKKESYLKILFHELTHLKQWVDGSLRLRYGEMCYYKEPVENYDYWIQPHEIESREMEKILYLQYLLESNGVPEDEIQYYFHNRLMMK